jgi:transposase
MFLMMNGRSSRALSDADAGGRSATPHVLRELFNGLRLIARTTLQSRCMPHDLSPWHVLYDQARRWLEAEVFMAVIDLRELIRIGKVV